MNSSDLSQISRLITEYCTQTKQLVKSEQIDLILRSAELTADQYQNLKLKGQYHALSMNESTEMLKYYVRQIYQLDSSKY